MAEITEERILEAVRKIKAAFADGFQWEDVATLAEEAAVFADLFVLSGPEKEALALRVMEKVLAETDFPWLPDTFNLPLVGDIGADALIMRFAPGLLRSIVKGTKGELAINKGPAQTSEQ